MGLKLNVSKMGPGMLNQSYKSHNAHVPYPTMHYFGKEMCTSFFSEVVYCGIRDKCILGFVQFVYYIHVW